MMHRRGLRLAPALGLLATLLVSATAVAQLPFTEVSAEAGVRFTHDPLGFYDSGNNAQQNGVGTGAAFVDFNGDRWLDLIISNGVTPGNFLYLNNGDGSFTDVSEQYGVRTGRVGNGIACGDLNNDGLTDVLIANHMFEANVLTGTRFSLSNQSANFGMEEIYFRKGEEPFGYDGPLSMGAALGDFDKDGYLDAYIANFLFVPDVLLRNYAGSFFLNTKSIVEPIHGYGCMPMFLDYDDDGDLDVFVVNDLMRDFLFRNEGRSSGWKFTEVALDTKIAGGATTRDPLSMGMGSAAGDFDNDLDMDIYVTNFRHNALWLNPGDWAGDTRHTFRNVAPEKNVDFPLNSWGCAFFDADNDMDLDLFMAGGWVEGGPDTQPRDIPNRLWLNSGPPDYTFQNITDEAGVGDTMFARSQSIGDYDRDGDLDIFLTNCSYYELGTIGQGLSQVGHPLLFRNDAAPTNHWINLYLRGAGAHSDGTGCNFDAVGAKVYLSANGVTQMRVVQAGSGFMGQDSKEVEFGLGSALQADRIEIRWPCGGNSVLQDVPADRYYRFFEEDESLHAAPIVFERLNVSPSRDGILIDWIQTPDLRIDRVDIQRRLPAAAGKAPRFETLELPLEYDGNRVFALDPDVVHGQSYTYRLFLIDELGDRTASPVLEVVAKLRPPLREPVLGQNFPNPMNPGTSILFSLPRASHVELRLYDVRGRLVRQLYEAELDAGFDYRVEWDGTDDGGKPMASGIYYYSLHAGESVQTRRLTLVR